MSGRLDREVLDLLPARVARPDEPDLQPVSGPRPRRRPTGPT